MKKIFLLTLISIAVLERTVWDLGPNIELVTTAIVLASLYLNRKESLLTAFIILAVSDRLLGNSNIFLFTWTGFLIPAALLSFVNKGKYRFLKAPLSGIGANLFFFIWTNFGVWALDSWGMYTKDLPGLMACYINALPFLKNQMVSSIVFIPAGIIAIELVAKPILSFIKDKAKPSLKTI